MLPVPVGPAHVRLGVDVGVEVGEQQVLVAREQGVHQWPEERPIPGIDIRSEALLKDRLLLSEKLWPNGGCYSLRQGPYKLVLHRNEGMLRRLGEGYLFRVDQDPEELHDLYREEPEVVESMTRILDDLEAAIRVSPGEEQTLSPQARETMRALGYIE